MKDMVERWIKKDGEKFLKDIGIETGQIVLDFGCGEGHYTIPAAKIVGEKGTIYGFDKDRDSLDRLMQIIRQTDIRNIE
jgi:ubiquinone/menaquinone biosynthesis C-methylase UbiE